MRRIFAFPLAAVAVSLAFVASPANAQASRTWVSGVGDDANPCSRTAPCKTFAGAISKTAVNGEINCLDPGGFGTVTITKSISLDCHEITGSILNAGTNGVNIAFDSFDPTDTRKTVNLRNLMIQGFDSGLAGVNIIGTGQGTVVNVEDTLITGEFGGAGNGIIDQRGRGMLNVTNTVIRNLGGAGISQSSSNNGSLRAKVTNVQIFNANNGILTGTNSYMVVSNSVVSGNASSGVSVAASSQMHIETTVISHNTTGLTANGTVNLAESSVILNSTAISGAINSYSNNRFAGNGSIGGTINTVALR